jgi:hypothetical protein
MTLTINLNEEQEARLAELAAAEGCDLQCFIQRRIEDLLFKEKLRHGGVLFGNREEAISLLNSWIGRDNDPNSTQEEWDEVQRNIEQSRYWYQKADI